MNGIDNKILLGIVALIVGAYTWVFRQMATLKRCVVSKEVCEQRELRNQAEHKRLDDLIEAAIAKSDEQHKDLKADMKLLKADVRSGFGEVKDLIRNGRRER